MAFALLTQASGAVNDIPLLTQASGAVNDIRIIAGELDSTGQPYPLGHHDRLFTEKDTADADTYDSDADAAAYGGDEL